MMSTCETQATLDGSAAEFIPSEELQQKINKRAAILQVSNMIEPIFQEKGKHFHSQLSQIRQLLSSTSVNAPHLIGEILAGLTTECPERTSVGFRFFKELRSIVSDPVGRELEAGLIKCVHDITRAVLTSNAFQPLMAQPTTNSTISKCDEAGDLPTKTETLTTASHLFGLVTFLNLLITRLNLDSPDEYVCIPPILPCINLCQIVEHACHLQNAQQRSRSESEPVISEVDVYNLRDWTGLFHQLCDCFHQSMPFFNCALTELNTRLLGGSWVQNGNLCEQNKMGSTVDNNFEYGAQLSCLLNEILTCMRNLLLDEKVPLKATRSILLDILICANQVSALTNFNLPENCDVNVSDMGLSESEGDDVYECYQRFLEETKQFVPP